MNSNNDLLKKQNELIKQITTHFTSIDFFQIENRKPYYFFGVEKKDIKAYNQKLMECLIIFAKDSFVAANKNDYTIEDYQSEIYFCIINFLKNNGLFEDVLKANLLENENEIKTE